MPNAAAPAIALPTLETLEGGSPRTIVSTASGEIVFETRADAEFYRDCYVALLRQLEFEQKRANLVPVATALAGVERASAKVRDRMLQIPGDHAAAICAARTAAEVEGLLRLFLTRGLDEAVRAVAEAA